MAETWKNCHARHVAGMTMEQRIADGVAATMGSWGFIIVRSIVLAVWTVLNLMAWMRHWDSIRAPCWT